MRLAPGNDMLDISFGELPERFVIMHLTNYGEKHHKI